jgi:hypothetical protein
MSIAQCSTQTRVAIHSAWRRGLPPIQVAHMLGLVPMTVIAEYVRLDELSK